MPRIVGRLIVCGAWLIALVLVAASVARGWQQPNELPIAPRVIDVEELLPASQAEAADDSDVFQGTDNGLPAADDPEAPPADDPTNPTNSSRRPRPALDAQTVPSSFDPAEPINPESVIELPPAIALEIKLPTGPGTPLTPAMFNQIEPGRTTREELIRLWGEPLRDNTTAERSRLEFRAEPFERVDAIIQEELVTSLVIHLPQPTDRQKVVEQLSLEELEPLESIDDTGKTVGQRFPERGIMLGFDSNAQRPLVTHIVLEPIAAEPFLLRVKSDRLHKWQQNFSDLQTAIWLNPDDDRAWWLQSELLSLQGEQRQAAASITQALQLSPKSLLYVLTGARILSDAGEFEMPSSTTRLVLENSSADPLYRARAAALLGDFAACSPPFDYQQALDYHQQSIKLSAPLAASDRVDVRRAAKRMLFEAHLAVANDLARGRWKSKEQAVPQWLGRAEAIADELLANDQGDPALRLELKCRQLDALSWLEGKVDAAQAVEQTQSLAQQITQEATDELYHNHVKWQLGKALVDGVDIHRARNETEQAIKIGAAAEATLTPLAEAGWRSEETAFQLSRLYFLLGSVQAVQRKDHAAALKWFDKAADVLARPEPDIDLRRTARRGEWLVSMGVTYWQQNDKERGLKLTELGAALVEGANREQAVAQEKLAVPYGNLAFMYDQLGHEEKAKQYSAMAAKIAPQSRQR